MRKASHMTSSSEGGIPARPTLYRGIRMRSRLEADFAAFLDRAEAEWEYEPECFAGPHGQWLPDFRATLPGGPPTYFEVKPESLSPDQVDPVLERMAIAWLTEPAATLQLVIWRYGDPLGSVSVMGFPHEDEDDDDLIWWVVVGDDDLHPWPGMGQFEQFLAERPDLAGGGGEPQDR